MPQLIQFDTSVRLNWKCW